VFISHQMSGEVLPLRLVTIWQFGRLLQADNVRPQNL